MAKRVKTDLFEGLMKAAEKKAVTEKAEEKKPASPVKEAPATKKSIPVKKTTPVKPTPEKSEEVEETVSIKPKTAVSLEQFLKKAQAPSSKSHTFYLKDSVYEKLVNAAKDNDTSPSKLLEALIQMNL